MGEWGESERVCEREGEREVERGKRDRERAGRHEKWKKNRHLDTIGGAAKCRFFFHFPIAAGFSGPSQCLHILGSSSSIAPEVAPTKKWRIKVLGSIVVLALELRFDAGRKAF